MTAPQIAATMSESEYRAIPALSQSGMKDLAVSPYRFWYLNINPNRPERKETPEMQFGSAMHCAVLQPKDFQKRYACEVDAPKDCLETMDDLRAFIRSKGATPKGTKKAEAIAQVQSIEPEAPILDVLKAAHLKTHAGKVILSRSDWQRVNRATNSLRSEPRVEEILSVGEPEVPLFVDDPDTGVPLKGRLDWLRPKLILDLKSFTQKRDKSIDKSITDAIFYEGYYRQAYFYSKLRGWPETWDGDFVIAFVESEEPHEVRLRSLRPKSFGNVNLYWQKALLETRALIRSYADCLKEFGGRPWRYAQDINPLVDEEMPGLAY
jgi:hypothetical protein